MNTIDNLKVEMIWTDKITDKQINDFICVHDSVFGPGFDKDRFFNKYISNIYGPSFVILAYNDGECVGTNGFQRNDLNFGVAYQSGDSAVLKKCAGCGIFKKMIMFATENVKADCILYGFANENSLPGFTKMNWKIEYVKKLKIYNHFRDFDDIEVINHEYINWILKKKRNKIEENIYYTKIKKKYLLIKKRKCNIYFILGEISKDNATKLNKALLPVLLLYSENGYLGRGLVAITKKNVNNVEVLVHKIDTIF